jgi:hypothetical protein
MDDKDYWNTTNPNDLWLFDKLILAKKLGYRCGPAGVQVPHKATWCVRPCVNYRMMCEGASLMTLGPEDDAKIPVGYFWCELFIGPHYSFDYHNGKQVLAVQGYRNNTDLTRFSKWSKIDHVYTLPPLLQEVADRYEWLNIEVIGTKIIECHLRPNDDFIGHNHSTIIPVWCDNFYPSACGDRVGFILQ